MVKRSEPRSPEISSITRAEPMHPKLKLLSIPAIAAAMIGATLLSAQPGTRDHDQTSLEGTWMGTAEPGAAPGLISFIAGGQVLWSRPSVVLTGPTVIPSSPQATASGSRREGASST